MSPKEAQPENAEVGALRDGIEQTRQEMSVTIGALERRLSPDTLSEKANAELDHLEARVKAAMKESIAEAKAAAAITVKESIEHAREAASKTVQEGVHEAKEAVTHGLAEARETVKKDLNDVLQQTKHSVREATLGRVEQFATKAGDIMNDSRDTLVETIRRNPVPAALAGVGIVWLLMKRSSDARRGNGSHAGNGYGGYMAGASPSHGSMDGDLMSGVGRTLASAQHAVTETAGSVAQRAARAARGVGDAVGTAGSTVAGAAHDAGAAAMGVVGAGASAMTHLAHDMGAGAGRLAHDASDATAHLAHDAMDAAGHAAERAQQVAGFVAGSAREQASRIEGGLETAWQTNPLAFGAAAAVVGAAVGYALPRTEKEDQLMGAVRDQVVHNVADLATDAVHSLQHVTEDAGKAASSVVKSAIS